MHTCREHVSPDTPGHLRLCTGLSLAEFRTKGAELAAAQFVDGLCGATAADGQGQLAGADCLPARCGQGAGGGRLQGALQGQARGRRLWGQGDPMRRPTAWPAAAWGAARAALQPDVIHARTAGQQVTPDAASGGGSRAGSPPARRPQLWPPVAWAGQAGARWAGTRICGSLGAGTPSAQTPRCASWLGGPCALSGTCHSPSQEQDCLSPRLAGSAWG